jgi:hypothetical protein
MKLNLKNVFLSVGIFAFTLALVGALSTSKAEAVAITFAPTGATGLWSVGANWSGGTVPLAADTITINAGKTVTVDVTSAIGGIIIADPAGAVATGIIINTGVTLLDSGSLAYAANTGTADQTILINGTGALSVATTTIVTAPTSTGDAYLTIATAGTFTPTGAVTINGSAATTGDVIFAVGTGTLTAGNALNINGGAGAGGGIAEISVAGGTITTSSGAGIVTLAGSATKAKLTSTLTGTHITISGALTDTAGVVNLTGTVDITGVLSLADGSISINSGTTTTHAATTIADAKTLTVLSGATAHLELGAITGTLSGSIVNGGTITAAAVTLGANGAITNSSTGTFSASGTITLGAGATVTNSGTFSTTGTAQFGTGAGIVLNTGTLNLAGGTTNALNVLTLTAGVSGTVNYTTGIQTIKAPTAGYYDLTLSGTGAKTFPASTVINNKLTIGSLAPVTLSGLTGNTAVKLYFGTAQQASGTWGSTTATSATHQNNTYFGAVNALITVAQGGTSSTGPTITTNPTVTCTLPQVLNSTGTTCVTPGTTDTTAPIGSVSINAGALTTSLLSSTLTLSATDAVGVTQMLVSNDAGFAGATWESYAGSKAWTLTSGDGVKTVYAQFKDATGNTSVAVSDIITVVGSGTVALPLEPTQGCSAGNVYNTSTGALCVNTAVATIIAGCNNRNTGFSTTTGQSCVGSAVSALVRSYNFGTVTLRNGSRGEAVMELQRFLNAKLGLGLVVDGKLGPKTIAVIKQWQASHGLVPDGLVGPKTKAQMNAEAN